MSEWGIEDLDLDAYLERIKVRTPTLHSLHVGHMANIPFENVDVLLGDLPALDLPSLQAKLVRRPRGGYCYEHNLLYAAALERLWIPVTRLAARVRLGHVDPPRARTHMLLMAESDGELWLTDVGWGGGGLLEPMPLRETTVRQGAWTFRLVNEGDLWVLQSKISGSWFDLYAFTLERQYPADYEVANYYTGNHPQSHFVTQLIIQATSAEVRRTLIGRESTVAGPDGVREKLTLTDDEVLDMVRAQFGIELTEDEQQRLRTALSPG